MASSARLRPRKRKLTTSSRLIRSSLTIGSAIVLANGLTAVTQLVLARLLHPADYSLLVTLFVVITIAGVPLAALQATIARGVAADFSERGALGAGAALIESARELARLSLPVSLALAALTVPAAVVLNVQHVAPIAAAVVVIAASAALTIVWAGLQGTHRFGALSFGQVGFAVLKLILAIGAAWAGAGVAGVIGAIGAATLVTLVVGVAPLAPYLRAAAQLDRVRRPLLTRYSRGAGLSLTLFAILIALDVLVARVALTASTAGVYAAASVVARSLLLIPTAITTVLFPHVSTLRDATRERQHLLGALGATAAASIVPVGLLLIAGGPIMENLFGSRYAAAAPWVGPLSIAMALYALAFVYLFHSLSVGHTRFWVAGVVVLAGQLVGFAALHGSGRDLVGVQIGAAAALVVAGEIFDRRAR